MSYEWKQSSGGYMVWEYRRRSIGPLLGYVRLAVPASDELKYVSVLRDTFGGAKIIGTHETVEEAQNCVEAVVALEEL